MPSSSSAPAGGGEIGMGIQQAMQLALMKAQKENIEALAEKVGISDEGFMDFVAEQGIKNFDAITVSQAKKCIVELGKMIDEKAKQKPAKARV